MKGWLNKTIAEVSAIYNGGTPDTKVKEYWGDEIFWITPKDMGRLDDTYVYYTERKITTKGLKNSSAKILPVNSVVLSSRAPIGHLAINKVEICTNQGCKGIVPSNQIDAKFLFYYLKSSVDLLESLGTGTTFKELSAKKLGEVPIPVPPVKEQKRIVSILDEAFAAIDKAKQNAEKNLQNAKELFESYARGIFSNNNELWEKKTLGEIGKVSMCKRILKNQTTAKGDIPFYKIGTFGKEPDAFISKTIYKEFREKYSFPKKGDILISASGTIGRRVKYDGEPAYFQDSNIVWIDNDEKQVLNDYLFQFYGVCEWKTTKGATISRLYNDNLKSIEIAFPKSQKQQEVIINSIEELSIETQKLIANYQRKVSYLEELRKSILQKAFTGELSVKRIPELV